MSFHELRRIGRTEIEVTPVALGCWPISGMTSRDVSEEQSIATICAAVDAGISFLDTAYAYGARGESERLIQRALGGRRDEVVIATKGGIHWGPNGERILDARPERLQFECEESLERLGTDYVDLLYLHAPDPSTPVTESAEGLRAILESGKARAIGVSNFTLQQLVDFHQVCPISAFQPAYNMLQREIENDTLPWCQARSISVFVYWPLMKGILAGRLPRDYKFDGDGRNKYPMYQGNEFQRNQDFVDRLRDVANACGRTVAQVVINWTIHRPGITAALCGAKRPEQIRETAGALAWRLSPEHLVLIDEAIRERGPIVARLPV